MPKHTPGPWKIKDDFAKTAINTEKKHIAMVNYWKCQDESCISDEEHEANARLIAAAPELLEVLMEVRDHAQDDAPAMWERVDAVIAKALKD